MHQLDLLEPLEQTKAPELPKQATRREWAEAFIGLNPSVYGLIVSIARDCKRAGWKRAGMKAIFEKIRWEYAERTRGGCFKMNNSIASEVSRIVQEREPDLRGFFETRGSKGK